MSTPIDYTLTCCPGRGLAEISRLLFTVSGTPFIDERITTEQWLPRKSFSPFGKLPLLTLKDGTIIGQSKSIERYLAKRFDLLGKNDTETALIDMIIEQLTDFQKMYWNAKTKKDTDGTVLKEFLSNDFPSQLSLFELFLSKRMDQSTPYFIGNQFSLADLCMYYFLWQIENTMSEEEKLSLRSFLKSAPYLNALKKAVASMPSIKEYEEKRPSTSS